MTKLNTREVHERRHRRIIGRRELESIITHVVHWEIRDALGSDDDVAAVDYKLTFEDETEGSPGYKVGTRCIVDVVERLVPPIKAEASSNARDLLAAQAQDQGLYDTTGGGE